MGRLILVAIRSKKYREIHTVQEEAKLHLEKSAFSAVCEVDVNSIIPLHCPLNGDGIAT